MKKINILGSTGIIGKKSLRIITNDFSQYKINYLLANNNYKLLAKQANLYNPNYIGLINENNYFKLKKLVKNKKIKIFSGSECKDVLKKNVNLSIMAISGISALKYIKETIIHSEQIGIANKESIVSAGKFLISLSKKFKTKIIPLDSEHFSIYNFLLNFKKTKLNKINEVYITASGGPFLYTDFNKFKNITIQDTLKHPTWKMGLKNTVDSSTMINKCLEIIEAHYLFNFDFTKLKIIIHPESLVHSIIKLYDCSLMANISNNDMSAPIFGFLNNSINVKNLYNNIDFINFKSLNFIEPDKNRFSSLKIFEQLDKNSISEIIVFNTSNEIAVDLFLKNKIKYIDITKFIMKSLNKFEKTKIYNINNVIQFQNYVYNKLTNYHKRNK